MTTKRVDRSRWDNAERWSRCGAVLFALSMVVTSASAATPGSGKGTSKKAPLEPPDGLHLSVRARSLAPGEAVRILVSVAPGNTAKEPYAGHTPFANVDVSVEGTFLGRPLAFARLPSGPAWSAWAVIDFDEKPGTKVVAVSAKDGEGHVQSASRSLRVLAKRFPSEKLTVKEEFVEPPLEVQERIAAETKRLASVYATRSPSAFTSAPFGRPVPGASLGTFGSRRIFNGKPRAPHPGLDLRAAVGTPVHASGPGRVALADDLYFSGRTVILDHGEGVFTIYAHLSEIQVHEGDPIGQGQVVGLSGATGRVTGPHLHWGAKLGDTPFDPRGLLAAALFGP